MVEIVLDIFHVRMILFRGERNFTDRNARKLGRNWKRWECLQRKTMKTIETILFKRTLLETTEERNWLGNIDQRILENLSTATKPCQVEHRTCL